MKVTETRNEITNPIFEIEKTKDDSNNMILLLILKKSQQLGKIENLSYQIKISLF